MMKSAEVVKASLTQTSAGGSGGLEDRLTYQHTRCFSIFQFLLLAP
jgi:hypothetical protein